MENFKQELRALLEKHGVRIGAIVEGDTHGVRCSFVVEKGGVDHVLVPFESMVGAHDLTE